MGLRAKHVPSTLKSLVRWVRFSPWHYFEFLCFFFPASHIAKADYDRKKNPVLINPLDFKTFIHVRGHSSPIEDFSEKHLKLKTLSNCLKTVIWIFWNRFWVVNGFKCNFETWPVRYNLYNDYFWIIFMCIFEDYLMQILSALYMNF